MENKTISSRTLLHSTYVSDIGGDEDAVVASEIIEYTDGTTEPNLRIFKSPKVSFWVTQEQYRGYTDKKEFEYIHHLDEYIVPFKQKDKEMFKALHGYTPNYLSHKQKREVYQSPYIYGGNISVEALIAMKYKKELLAANKVSSKPITGFFDIEKSLLKETYGELPLMVFTSENKVFLAMKRSFMREERNGVMVDVTIDDIRKAAHHYIDPLVEQIFKEKGKDLNDYRDKLPFEYVFFAGDTEVDMIYWIFDRMHETKTSFIGIWNLKFDIPEIIKVLERSGIPIENVFAHPSLRNTKFAHAEFKEDKRKVHHFTQKWHWMSATAHFQFVDSTALYSYIRQVEGKESSYALDNILKKFGIGGKLKIDTVKELDDLQTADWHKAMLSRFFVPYALYAMWDGMGLQILEWLNNDLTAMMLLSDTTPPKFFPNQTIRVTNTLFQDWLPKGYVLGTGIDVEASRDDDLITEGGAVLEPQNLIARGLKLFAEWPNHHTHCYAWQNDFDFSAQYPTNTMVVNISKQTKIGTMFAIKGDYVSKRYSPEEAVEVFCSYVITPNANGVEIGTDFFNLPNYDEINELFINRLNKDH